MTDRVVVLTEGELRAIVREEVARAVKSAGDPGEWMTPEEVARMLDVERSTVPTLVTRDGLPAYRPGRKGYVFKRSDVVAWLEQRVVAPGSHGRRHGGRLQSIKGG